jgi:integrase
MPTNKLTNHVCNSAKPKAKGYKLTDGGGLYLFITPTGAKSWRMSYRINQVAKTVTFGLYPLITLAEARIKRDGAKRLLIDSIDPGLKKKGDKPAISLAVAFNEYWSGRKDVSPNYRHDCFRAFANHVEPTLGEVPINKIDRPQLLACLLKIDRSGHPVAAIKMRTYLMQVWEWAIELGHCQENVPQSIKPAKAFSKEKIVHFRAIDLPEVPAFWARLNMEQHRPSGVACKMLAYTWTRTKELRMMRWSEIDGNVWRIPASVMKKDRDHIVPLPRQALELLKKIKPFARGDLVFAGARDINKSISENTILFLIYEMDYRGRMTGHGFRTLASTWANDHGYNRDAIERQLSHAPDDKVRSAYNRSEYMKEREKMLQDWADWLDSGGFCKNALSDDRQ